MKKKEELFHLIQALTRSEKRYFKVFCSGEKSGHNYLKLFDAISAQEVYDEALIKKKFQSEKFTQQLHVTKNYLRQLILKSLRNFHTSISKNAELNDLLHNVEILFNKELYQLCQVELKKAKKLALTYELLTGMVEVEKWNRKLEQTTNPQNHAALSKACNNQAEAIEILRNNNIYWQMLVDHSNNLFGGADLPNYPAHLLSNVDEATSLEAKVLFYNISYLRNLKNNTYDRAEDDLNKILNLLEKRPLLIYEDPGLFVSCLNNLLSFQIFMRKHDKALQMIQKAKKIYKKWRITSENKTLFKQVLRTYSIELEVYRETRSFESTLGFILQTEQFVETNQHKMPKEYLISFWFQFASIHFIRKDFSQSLEWINRLLNTKLKSIRADLQVQARLLNLIIHLEQENLMVLRYFVDSTKRYMKKVKTLQDHETILLRFFIKIGRLPLSEYKTAFKELKHQLFPEERKIYCP